MASRPSKNDTPETLDLVKVFLTLLSFDASESDPVTVKDFAEELSVTEMEAFNALELLADAELADSSGRGLNSAWYVSVTDVEVTEDNAEEIAREALANAVPGVKTVPSKLTPKEQDYKDRTEYAARQAESQDAVFSQTSQRLTVRKDSKTGDPLPAVTPVKAADGTTVTVPVDPENNPTGPRRELDASQGERVISEDDMRTVVKGLATYKGEDGETLFESSIEKNGLALEEPEKIPSEIPAGVNPNTWYMAHAAITQTARDWWLMRVEAQKNAHDLNQPVNAPF